MIKIRLNQDKYIIFYHDVNFNFNCVWGLTQAPTKEDAEHFFKLVLSYFKHDFLSNNHLGMNKGTTCDYEIRYVDYGMKVHVYQNHILLFNDKDQYFMCRYDGLGDRVKWGMHDLADYITDLIKEKLIEFRKSIEKMYT